MRWSGECSRRRVDPADMANEGDMVRPWDSLSADEKTLFSRMAEVYAAYSQYTDVQVGRILDYLEKSGQLARSSEARERTAT